MLKNIGTTSLCLHVSGEYKETVRELRSVYTAKCNDAFFVFSLNFEKLYLRAHSCDSLKQLCSEKRSTGSAGWSGPSSATIKKSVSFIVAISVRLFGIRTVTQC